MRPVPQDFSLWHDTQVRFKDLDVGGHAHHSIALVYFEEARARYWHQVAGGNDPEKVDFILAEARVRYHARILYPQTLSVGVRITSMGKKHFVMEYLARSQEGEDLASGETTLVMYDYGAGKTKRIPDDIRSSIQAWEGMGAASSEADRVL
jgi:acyl-CoA thioester hydrolase